MSYKSMMQFAEYMVSRSAFLRDHCRDTELYSDPHEPLAIPMLGYFGGQIVRQYGQITPEEWKLLTRLMEEGMESEDDDIRTAMATGMIEVMVNVAEREELWPTIEAGLGPLSREYADAYRAWDRTAYRSS